MHRQVDASYEADSEAWAGEPGQWGSLLSDSKSGRDENLWQFFVSVHATKNDLQ